MKRVKALKLGLLISMVGIAIISVVYFLVNNAKRENEREQDSDETTSDLESLPDLETLTETSSSDTSLDLTDSDVGESTSLTGMSFTGSDTSLDDVLHSAYIGRQTDSTTSVNSTESEDLGRFPAGDKSTFRHVVNQVHLDEEEFHEILNSSVIKDERWWETNKVHTIPQLSSHGDVFSNDTFKMDSTKYTSIVQTYSNIVTPLKPNTGVIFQSPQTV